MADAGYPYTKDLHNFVRDRLSSLATLPPAHQSLVLADLKYLLAETAQSLILHNGLALNVYGENAPLAFLVGAFNQNGVEALLEQNAIEFVFQTSLVTYMLDNVDGVLPLQTGRMTSPEHCDPEQSVAMALERLPKPIPESQKSKFVQKVADAYKTIPQEFAINGMKYAYSAHENGKLISEGLPPSLSISDFSEPQRQSLAKVAGTAADLCVMAMNGYDALGQPDLLCHFERELLEYARLNKLEHRSSTILKVEGLPDLRELFFEGQLRFADLPAMRVSQNAVKYRAWLAEHSDSQSTTEIHSEYVQSLATDSRWSSASGKLARVGTSTLASTLLGALIGSLVGGPIGATLGGVGSAAIGAVDALLIEKLTEGWSPRNFVNEVKRRATTRVGSTNGRRRGRS